MAEIRLSAKSLLMAKIDFTAQGGFVEFSANAADPMKFLQLIQQDPKVYRFDGPTKFRINKNLESHQERLNFIADLIQKLADCLNMYCGVIEQSNQ